MCNKLIFNTIAKMKLTYKIIPPLNKIHSGTVIFLHGSGDTGHNLIEWVRFLLGRDMQFGHIKIIYPTAPVQPYTILNGQPSNVWFDRRQLHIDAAESRKSLAAIYEPIKNLIQSEVDLGIPLNRIIVGGFSMGGALAIHTGYHIYQELGGVFACSSFLNNDSIVYDSIKNKTNPNDIFPELLQFHGDRDSLVMYEWGRQSFDALQALGIGGEFITLKNTMHELKKKELLLLQDWIVKKLPNFDGDIVLNKL